MLEPRDDDHTGVLIRGATGELWFLRDDYDAPRKVDNPRVVESVRNFAGKEGEQVFTFSLPQSVLDALNEADFGPLFWGVIMLSAPRLIR